MKAGWQRLICTAGAVAAGLSVAVSAAAGAKPAATKPVVCALIPDTALAPDKWAGLSLLEARLGKRADLRLVDRTEISRVLTELKLKLMFSPTGAAERRRAGKILKADVLICLRAGKANEVEYVEVVACETISGLRLLVRSVARSDDAASDAAAIEKVIAQALAKHAEQVRQILAVPPFVSGDLTHEHDYLQTVYARLIEQMLLGQKGVLVVELAEAQAVAREQRLAGVGEGVERRLPLYLLGEYRNGGNGQGRTLTVKLALRRGDKPLGSSTKSGLAPEAVAAWLRQAAAALVSKAAGQKLSPPDPDLEARLLAQRGATFQLFGNWSEALAMYEASLLIKPGQPLIHKAACTVLCRLISALYDPYGDRQNFVRKARIALAYYRRYPHHQESYLRGVDVPDLNSMGDRSGIRGSIVRYAREHSIDKVVSLYSEIHEEFRGMYLRIFEAKAAAGPLDPDMVWPYRHMLHWDIAACYKTWEAQCEARLRVIRLIHDQPDARYHTLCLIRDSVPAEVRLTPKYRQFIEQVAKIPNKQVQAGAADALARLERELAERSRPPTPRAPHEPAPEPGQEQIVLRKLPINYQFSGLVACGEGVDLAWGQSSLYIMKKPGKLKLIYANNGRFFHFKDVVYDGRYAWALAIKQRSNTREDPIVMAIDPQTEQIHTFTMEDGLPGPISGAITPWGPGAVCVIGRFPRGTWCGLLRFDKDKGKSVETVHEAREFPSGSLPDGEAPDADTVFSPKFMVTLEPPGKPAEKRILVGRSVGNVRAVCPLLIEPVRKQVTVLPAWSEARRIDSLAVTAHDGSVWWAKVRRVIVRGKKTTICLVTLFRAGFPDFKMTQVGQTMSTRHEWVAPYLLFRRGRLHLLGYNWWMAERPGAPLRRQRVRVTGNVTKEFGDLPGKPYFRRYCVSNHYGPIIVQPHEGVFQVEFKNDQSAATPHDPDSASGE